MKACQRSKFRDSRPGILAALSVVLLSACGPEVPARFEIDEERSLAVLPASDPEFGGGIFGSPRGAEIAKVATVVLRQEFGDEFVIAPEVYRKAFDKMLEKYYDPSRPSWTVDDEDVKDPAALTRQEIANHVKSDYVVFVHIDRWKLRPDESYNMLKGTATLTVEVFDNRGLNLKSMGTETLAVEWPSEFVGRDGITEFDGTEAEVEDGLKANSGKKIAQLFFEHDKDDSYRIRLD